MPLPFLLVVTGPSGGGKSTLIARLLADCPWLRKVVTATTRGMRPGEADGREYRFLSPERFRALLDEGGLLEHETYAGFEYGTPVSELELPGETAEGVVLDLDIRGARTLKRLHPSRTSVVFVAPPSLESLETRLKGRGTETPAARAARLEIARRVMAEADARPDAFDFRIVNDDVAAASARLRAFAEGIRGGLGRNPA